MRIFLPEVPLINGPRIKIWTSHSTSDSIVDSIGPTPALVVEARTMRDDDEYEVILLFHFL